MDKLFRKSNLQLICMGASPWSDQTGGMGGPRGMWGRLTWISTGAWRIIHVKKGESCHQYIQIILLTTTVSGHQTTAGMQGSQWVYNRFTFRHDILPSIRGFPLVWGYFRSLLILIQNLIGKKRNFYGDTTVSPTISTVEKGKMAGLVKNIV